MVIPAHVDSNVAVWSFNSSNYNYNDTARGII